MEPRVSIVMPVHNRSRYVDGAIASVLAQSFRDFELIIWDDGSTDDTPAICDRLADADPRVRVFHEPRRTTAPAMKLALAHARGRFLGWVDSDDLLLPGALEQTVAHLAAHPACGMVYTDHVIMNDRGERGAVGRRCSIPYSPTRLLVDFMTFHFRLIRREAFDLAGGIDDRFSAAYDYDFCLRLSECARIDHLAVPLYAYRVHDDAISTSRRLEQIDMSALAVRLAMARRGMDTTHELNVEIIGKFSIRQRPPAT